MDEDDAERQRKWEVSHAFVAGVFSDLDLHGTIKKALSKKPLFGKVVSAQCNCWNRYR